MDEIMHIVDTKVRGTVRPLTEEEKKTCDMVLCGYTPTKAYMEAFGLVSADNREYHRIASKASAFIRTQRAQRYLMAHRQKARIIVEQDIEALAVHMYDIAMGNDKKEVAHYDKNDGWVHTEVSPSHSDQIAAAAWVKGWFDDKRRTQLMDLTAEESRKQEEVESKAKEFLAMFSGHKVLDGTYRMQPSISEELDSREEVGNLPGEVETDPAVVRQMITQFADGDGDIADKILVDYARRTED